MKTVYSIGHSNHSIEVFIEMLQAYNIRVLVDVRTYPGSRYLPHFNKPFLSKALSDAGIQYMHFPALGGKRQQTAADGATTRLSYEEYMETATFQDAIYTLEEVALQQPLAFMCAEASWRNCHRRFISGHLDRAGWQVLHIKTTQTVEVHDKIISSPGDIQGSLF